MKTLVLLVACTAALAIAGPQQVAHARASSASSAAPLEPSGQLDEPLQLAAAAATTITAGETNEDTAAMDDICVRCYDKVKAAQDLVNVHDGLLRKQKKLITRMRAALVHAAAGSAPPVNQRQPALNSANSSVRSRTLLAHPGEPIVVSRLRVARSPATAVEQYQRPAAEAGAEQQRVKAACAKPVASLNKKDHELERLKREQQRQKELTCRALLEVRDCLDQLSRECIGNLQFHSYEVFSDQWYGKLRCPYPNSPGLKPLPGLSPRSFDEADARVPVPRPISSDDEVRQRLQKILPDRQATRHLGVMLKPTITTAAGTQQQQQQQQEQQQLQLRAAHQGFRRDYSPHLVAADNADQSVNLVNVGKILLVPCAFAIFLALLALASLHFRPMDEHDKDREDEDQAHGRICKQQQQQQPGAHLSAGGLCC